MAAHSKPETRWNQHANITLASGVSPGYTDCQVLPLSAYRLQVKGGSFTGDDKDFLKVRLGSDQVIPAFEEALRGMKVGGIRRIIVPEVCVLTCCIFVLRSITHEPAQPLQGDHHLLLNMLQEIGYPKNSFDTVGPQPSNFSVGGRLTHAFFPGSCRG